MYRNRNKLVRVFTWQLCALIFFPTFLGPAIAAFQNSDGPPGLKCEFWMIVASEKEGSPYNVQWSNPKDSPNTVISEVLTYQGIANKVANDTVWVPCNLYRDMHYVSLLTELMRDPLTPSMVRGGSLEKIKGERSNLHAFLGCEFWLLETDPRNFHYPWYLTHSTFASDRLDVIDDILDVEGVRHSVVGDKVAVECAIYQNESYLLMITGWVTRPEDRPWLNPVNWPKAQSAE